MGPDKNSLGGRLKYLRHQKGWTQEAVAQKFHIAKSTLSSYERDKRNPDFKILVKFSAFYHVSLDYLITGEEFHST